MKEVEKKDVPEISGGLTDCIPLPGPGLPYPTYPQTPGGPTDAPDPLGDHIRNNQVQS